MRIDISIPEEWLPALRELAERKDVSLSRLLCESAFALLPTKEQRQLPPARKRGRPRNDEAQPTPKRIGKGKSKSE